MTAAGREQRAVNGTGVFLVIVGAGLVLLALVTFDWYSVSASGADTSGEVTFRTLHTSAEELGGAGVTAAYFSWAAWAAVIGVVVIGWLANVPWFAANTLRVVGFAIGFVGCGATYYALRQHVNATGSTHGVFYHSSWGVWAALAGFALAALGAVSGPRRV